MNMIKQPLRVGVGGPVGSEKRRCWKPSAKPCATRQLAVVTNDIYTKEDQRILTEAGAPSLNELSVSKPAAARIPPFGKTRQ